MPVRPVPIAVALATALLLAVLVRAAGGDPAAPAGPAAAPGPLGFAADVLPADRQLVTATIAAARPEARALVDAVDGLVEVRVGPARPGAAGTTTSGPDGRHEVVLDLAQTYRHLGDRGVARLVLHELGHVVDAALLPPEVTARLDAGVPRGLGCERGVTGTCAPREERFAESFAKWATGDIGVGLSIGYEVPPPGPTPERWGEPLARLAAELRPAASPAG